MSRFSLPLILFLALGFSQERDRILFPHDFHLEEVELECAECHAGVEASSSLATRLLPEKETCITCHDGDSATDECAACHTNSEEPQTYSPLKRKGDPEFSHARHLQRFANCGRCHGGIETDDGSEKPFAWKDADCRACHTITKPENHTLSWISDHGPELNTGQNCAFCHEDTYCDRCHRQQQFLPLIHPSDYLMKHNWEAAAGVQECSTCHERERDCVSCHRLQNIMPMNHNFPNWTNLVLNDGGDHAEAALDEADICQVCHEPAADNTCRRCHKE